MKRLHPVGDDSYQMSTFEDEQKVKYRTQVIHRYISHALYVNKVPGRPLRGQFLDMERRGLAPPPALVL